MVDYNLSLNEVLISLARSLMSDSSKLGSPVDILSHAQGVKSSQTTPSWVPEWTFGRHDGPALVYSYPSSKGGTRKQAAWTIQPDDSLKLNGVIFDTLVNVLEAVEHETIQRIDAIDPAPTGKEKFMEMSKILPKWHDDCLRLASQLRKYSDRERLREDIWRTFTMNVESANSDSKPLPEAEKFYQAWVESIHLTRDYRLLEARPTLKYLRWLPCDVDDFDRCVGYAFGVLCILEMLWNRRWPRTWWHIPAFIGGFIECSNLLTTICYRLPFLHDRSWARDRVLSLYKDAEEFNNRWMITLGYRCFVTTTNERFGWVSRTAKPEDKLCSFQGSRVLYVIRPISEVDRTYELVGDAYIHGMMDEEPFLIEDLEIQTVILK